MSFAASTIDVLQTLSIVGLLAGLGAFTAQLVNDDFPRAIRWTGLALAIGSGFAALCLYFGLTDVIVVRGEGSEIRAVRSTRVGFPRGLEARTEIVNETEAPLRVERIHYGVARVGPESPPAIPIAPHTRREIALVIQHVGPRSSPPDSVRGGTDGATRAWLTW